MSTEMISDLLEQASSLPDDPSWVGPLCRGVARRLLSEDVNGLRALRVELGQARDELESESRGSGGRPVAAGVLRALTEVVAAADTAAEGRRERESRLLASRPLKQGILERLCESALSPSELVAALGSDKYQVARALRDLSNDGLVEQARRAVAEDGRIRRYQSTPIGRSLVVGSAKQGPASLKEGLTRIASGIVHPRRLRQGRLGRVRIPMPPGPPSMAGTIPAYIIVMDPEATPGNVEQAVQRTETAGGEAAFVAAGEDHTIIGVVGVGEQLESRLSDLSHVQEVIGTAES